MCRSFYNQCSLSDSAFLLLLLFFFRDITAQGTYHLVHLTPLINDSTLISPSPFLLGNALPWASYYASKASLRDIKTLLTHCISPWNVIAVLVAIRTLFRLSKHNPKKSHFIVFILEICIFCLTIRSVIFTAPLCDKLVYKPAFPLASLALIFRERSLKMLYRFLSYGRHVLLDTTTRPRWGVTVHRLVCCAQQIYPPSSSKQGWESCTCFLCTFCTGNK